MHALLVFFFIWGCGTEQDGIYNDPNQVVPKEDRPYSDYHVDTSERVGDNEETVEEKSNDPLDGVTIRNYITVVNEDSEDQKEVVDTKKKVKKKKKAENKKEPEITVVAEYKCNIGPRETLHNGILSAPTDILITEYSDKTVDVNITELSGPRYERKTYETFDFDKVAINKELDFEAETPAQQWYKPIIDIGYFSTDLWEYVIAIDPYAEVDYTQIVIYSFRQHSETVLDKANHLCEPK